MAVPVVENGISLEVLGTCMTNTRPGSQHDAKVEYRHLWSYAQQAALIAVSEKKADQCYHLITDPERRARRIAAHYADLYFKSFEKSQKKVQFYWPALAAFVVKDIVEAFRFAREDVLQNKWDRVADAARNNSVSGITSLLSSEASPYQHSLRTYIALAKGNLWLFMDIYPWLWFFLEYGINKDGSINTTRLNACLDERNWETFQVQSKTAVEELPFGPNWLGRLKQRVSDDPVYAEARQFFDTPPVWTTDSGYGSQTAAAYSAHRHARLHAKGYDHGYRTPPGIHWSRFQQAFYVMEAERMELLRVANDQAALTAVVKARSFRATPEIKAVYGALIQEHAVDKSKSASRLKLQKLELELIAKQEQINVLQPLIYNDPKLRQTMAVAHHFSRMTAGWLSPEFKVVYSAAPKTDDPELQTIFDAPDGLMDRLLGAKKDLTNQEDRMEFVDEIARKFNKLMSRKRSYMDGELRRIQGWMGS
jgi:hypothetical protein